MMNIFIKNYFLIYAMAKRKKMQKNLNETQNPIIIVQNRIEYEEKMN